MNSENLSRFNEIFKILKHSGLVHGITPLKLSKTLEELGPTFIKIGQILSTRVDLLPDEYIIELSRLRSNAIPLSYEIIESILKEQYENIDDIFLSIDKNPIGSASIAQVHKAVLKRNNKTVVLKVKRPNIEQIIYNDIQLFKRAVSLLHLTRIIKVIDLTEVLDQIYDVTKEETNFEIEVNNLIKFNNLNEYSKTIKCPEVYKNLCTSNVIVMEYIEGIKINDINTLKEKKYNLEVMANILSYNYITQAVTHGFFHADPHPDNIVVRRNNIVYIDFGMMGHLTEKNKQLLKKCIKAIVFKDYKEVSRILVNMSTRLDEIDYETLNNDVSVILEEFGDLELESISTSKFITDMFSMLRRNHLLLDKDVTMLIRGIGIIEPVLKNLNPKISLFKVLKISQQISMNDLFNHDKLKNKSTEIMKKASNFAELPAETLSFLKSLNNGESKFKIELSDSTKHIDKLENLVHEIILGFICGCLIIASVITPDKSLKSIFIISLSIISIWLLIKMIIDIIHRGY